MAIRELTELYLRQNTEENLDKWIAKSFNNSTAFREWFLNETIGGEFCDQSLGCQSRLGNSHVETLNHSKASKHRSKGMSVNGFSDIEVDYRFSTEFTWIERKGILCSQPDFLRENKIMKFLIENKINAKFQNRQLERYVERGYIYISQGACDDFRVICIAPNQYLNKHYDYIKENTDFMISSESVLANLFSSLIITQRSLYMLTSDSNSQYENDSYQNC